MNTNQKIKEASYTADQVADFFIHLSTNKMVDDGISEGITPLKLQKLLYFGQAVSLSMYNAKLFKEEIEAWKYGPVVSSIYHTYKDQQNIAITVPNGKYLQINDNETKELLQGVWELFDKYSASELVEITHQHQPWKDTYKENKNEIMQADFIRDYYRNIFVLKD